MWTARPTFKTPNFQKTESPFSMLSYLCNIGRNYAVERALQCLDVSEHPHSLQSWDSHLIMTLPGNHLPQRLDITMQGVLGLVVRELPE